MSHDLSLAQSHAFQLSRDLMVPVTAFQIGGEYGVLPSDEIDADDDLDVVHEFFPWPAHRAGHSVLVAASELPPAREASPRLAGLAASFGSSQPRPCRGLLFAALGKGGERFGGRKRGAVADAAEKE